MVKKEARTDRAAPTPPTPEEIATLWEQFTAHAEGKRGANLPPGTIASLRKFLAPAERGHIPTESELIIYCTALHRCPGRLKPAIQQALAERYWTLPDNAIATGEAGYNAALGVKNPDSPGAPIAFALIATLDASAAHYAHRTFPRHAALFEVEVQAVMERSVIKILNATRRIMLNNPARKMDFPAYLNTSLWRGFANFDRTFNSKQLALRDEMRQEEGPHSEPRASATSGPVATPLESWLAVEEERRREAFEAELKAFVQGLPAAIDAHNGLTADQKKVWKAWAEKALKEGEPPTDKAIQQELGINAPAMRSLKWRGRRGIQEMFLEEGLVRTSEYKGR